MHCPHGRRQPFEGAPSLLLVGPGTDVQKIKAEEGKERGPVLPDPPVGERGGSGGSNQRCYGVYWLASTAAVAAKGGEGVGHKVATVARRGKKSIKGSTPW